MARPWRRITPEKRCQTIRLAAQGKTYRQIAEAVDLSKDAVAVVVKPLGGVIRKEMWDPGGRRLSLDDRVEIQIGLERDHSLRAIARNLDRSPSTISREVKANSGPHNYRALAAHKRAETQATPSQAHQARFQLEAARPGRGRSQEPVVT